MKLPPNRVRAMFPKPLHVAVLIAIGACTLGAQGAPVHADSLRASRGVRLLELMQSFQMANTPELASAVNDVLSDTNAHMAMGPRKTATAADSARAAEIVRVGRAGLEKYKDVKVAEQDGYQKFLPWLESQSIYHYNNLQNVFASVRTFDATKPVSLLYTKGADGTMTLVGGMYTGGVYSTPRGARRATSHWDLAPNPAAFESHVRRDVGGASANGRLHC